MAKGNNQKLKLLYLAQILFKYTDETHGITMPEIIEKLSDVEVTADRKTIYQDMEELRSFGYDIVGEKNGRDFFYSLVSRDFELAELKLLVDSVQAAKFITEEKSNALIHKLETLVSLQDAKQLQRQVVISDRVKTMNNSVYYSVDSIHRAIGNNHQIRFQYFQWNVKKEMELRHDGMWYEISPWGLVWDDENYYLVGYDALSGLIKHYRVDKMLSLSESDTPREGQDVFRKFNMPKYSKSLFGMFGGALTKVTLLCRNSMAGMIIDRFGQDIMMIPHDADNFTVIVEVSVSRQFLGWIAALGDGVRIVGPASVVSEMQDMLAEQLKLYSAE